MWAGIVMMTVVADVLAYFRWWTKAALAVVVVVVFPVHGDCYPREKGAA